jgi:hypothetical protein
VHLDVEELAGGVAREHVELDVLAGELLGKDRRVEHLEHLHRGLARPHGADELAQQLRRRGEQAFEDVVVLHVEQLHRLRHGCPL